MKMKALHVCFFHVLLKTCGSGRIAHLLSLEVQSQAQNQERKLISEKVIVTKMQNDNKTGRVKYALVRTKDMSIVTTT